jgi:hypothetical protein
MKKVIVASILGIALSIASSYGQGYVIMQNYDLVGGTTPVYAGVTYSGGGFVGASSGIQVELFYSLTGAAGSYNLVSGSLTSFFTGSHDGGSPVTDGAGSFFGPTLAIPGYTSGNAFFYVQAVSTFPLEGQSAVFSMPLQTNNLLVPTDLLNLNGTTIQGLQPFVIGPEPSTPALSCLAGALMFLGRRKKASFSRNNLNPKAKS